MIFQKRFLIFVATLAALAGCSSTASDTNTTTNSSNHSSTPKQFAQLSANQIHSQIVGNTLTGTSNNFPQAGPIDFSVHYASDGTAKDRLKFRRGGRIDRATGTWRVSDEGIFCSTFDKRRQGVEVCTRIFVSNDQFRSEPVDSNFKGTSGRIVLGDQVN